MARAKYGSETVTDISRARGPLAAYDLVVISGMANSAWLHVVVPKSGRLPARSNGRHVAAVGGQAWVALSDYLEVGRDYVPFKRNGGASLHRQWGRISVVQDVVKIAKSYRARTGVPLGIGDISHVTGGDISDHITHERGEDVDFYLIAFDGDTPLIMWHQESREGSYWSDGPDGSGLIEDPDPKTGRTPSDERLRILADLALDDYDIAYFVHDAVDILEPFDRAATRSRPNKRFLHARNRGHWPAHRDHVHLRWVEGSLPGGVPRP